MSNGQHMTDVEADRYVRYEVNRGFATLTLDSPHNRNAISGRLVDELLQGLRDAAADNDVRGVVLTHTGSTFCAGADLSETSGDVGSRTRQMAALLRAIVELPKPVIARIDGHVRAGGMGLVGACDIAVAGPRSTFALTEVRLGLAASIISLTVLPRIDSRAASRYLLTGEKFGAHEAEAIGLISESAEDPEDTVQELLDQLRQASPQGLAESKTLTTRSVLADFDRYTDELTAQSARLFESEEAREGMMAFLQKRPPRWASGPVRG
ncbi:MULTISPECIES: enoyl-CoA hydratase family protein [unclassified Rhodococcus (in: high G+C Gram-positive bacteria)]|jgi:enoyl-CoA hydratase|uniref:enoyl-CoA hydratase family protein n=1 Tax=unclassified Rhodococcus (in: high G+C Gram-positive bacteria) TaxID=192944 RepID=UPI000272264B|nr:MULTISPECIES: enoyl-CoA hydratase family protein [unclassified Rhodococcus (in: high G+C Gram-positive bacteria)]EJI99761.1 enoyl-CoA hydratase/isomerase family protein [Rhodococcus sp. JVH1]